MENSIVIRRAAPDDAAACGRICFEAFSAINAEHNFPPEIPSAEAGAGLLGMLFSHPGFYTLVAEVDGRIVGSNCLDERSAIAGVGPVTVDPSAQNQGVGRLLMHAVLERAREAGFAGVRLVQSSFHLRSLSLYSKLGFQVREPLVVMRGPAIGLRVEGYTVRDAGTNDLDACNRICRGVHGHDRTGELREAIGQGSATVVERSGRVCGYATSFGYFGHVVGESTPDAQALISAAKEFPEPGILVPTRNAELFSWCLTNGLRAVLPMNLMTMGLYNEPQGAYLPCILY
jgi:predicted N-acetyltransferase YhbS